MNVGLNAMSANIKTDINLEHAAKCQRRGIYLPCEEQVFPTLWKGNRKTSPSLCKGELEVLRCKILILGWAATFS